MDLLSKIIAEPEEPVLHEIAFYCKQEEDAFLSPETYGQIFKHKDKFTKKTQPLKLDLSNPIAARIKFDPSHMQVDCFCIGNRFIYCGWFYEPFHEFEFAVFDMAELEFVNYFTAKSDDFPKEQKYFSLELISDDTFVAIHANEHEGYYFNIFKISGLHVGGNWLDSVLMNAYYDKPPSIETYEKYKKDYGVTHPSFIEAIQNRWKGFTKLGDSAEYYHITVNKTTHESLLHAQNAILIRAECSIEKRLVLFGNIKKQFAYQRDDGVIIVLDFNKHIVNIIQ